MSDVSTKASPYATPLSPRHVPRTAVAKGLKSERVLHRATTRPSSAIGLPLSPKKIVAPATNGGGNSSSSGGGGGGAGDRGGSRAKSSLYDRFIPNRSAIDITSSQFNLDQASNTSGGDPMASDAGDNSGATGCLDSNTLAYQEEVARACGVSLNKRILAFSAEAPVSNKEDLRQIYSHRPPLKTTASINNKRRILATPERVLDAPGLVDDYYLNLLDWSCTNVLAIGLDTCVYLWNADTGDVSVLCDVNTDQSSEGATYVSSISWTSDGSYLAVGTSDGACQIWDAGAQSKLRTMNGHTDRVGSLSWSKHILSSGCRDGTIWHHDVRVANHKVAELVGHTSEVCGLKWRSDGQLLASGGNDNLVNIWDARATNVPKFTKSNHTAAVRALAWSPWQLNLLATGGGSYDRHIHFWNTTTTARLSSIDTGSQVTSIIWSSHYKELVSSHGFPDNHLAVWSYPSLSKIIDIPAHDTRVLHSAISPDGQTVATVASDENLKFWRLFEAKAKATKTGPLIGSQLQQGQQNRNSVVNSFESRPSIR